MWIWLWDYKELELIDPFHQLLHKVHWEYHVKISLKIFYIFWYLDTNICFTRINKSKKKRVGTDASLTDTAYLQQHRASINQLKYETRKVGTQESTPHEKYYMIWYVAIPQIPDYLKAKCKSRTSKLINWYSLQHKVSYLYHPSHQPTWPRVKTLTRETHYFIKSSRLFSQLF